MGSAFEPSENSLFLLGSPEPFSVVAVETVECVEAEEEEEEDVDGVSVLCFEEVRLGILRVCLWCFCLGWVCMVRMFESLC